MNDEPLKYIIVNGSGPPLAIVFSPLLSHREVASPFNDVVSAGFCYLLTEGTQNAVAWGESVSLGIKSRIKEDSAILSKLI